MNAAGEPDDAMQTAASTPSPQPAPAFPPPDFTDTTKMATGRAKLLAGIAALAIAAATAFGLLWMSSRGERDDAVAARDVAIAERNESTTNDAAADQLVVTQAELEEALADNQVLQGEVDAAEAAAEAAQAAADAAPDPSVDVEPVVDTAEVDRLSTEVDALTTENGELLETNQGLSEQLAELQAVIDAQPDPAPSEPGEVPPAFDPAASPEFARYVGEVVSSSSGSTSLGPGQATCLGTELLNAIDFETLGKGLNIGASSGDTDVVIQAIEGAAAACGIAPSAVF